MDQPDRRLPDRLGPGRLVPFPGSAEAGARVSLRPGRRRDVLPDGHRPGPPGRGTALPAIGGDLDGGGLHDDLRPLQVRLRPTRPRHFPPGPDARLANMRSEEHTSELQSLMRISYAVFC